LEPSKERGEEEICLRLAKNWLEIRMGERMGAAFCAGRAIWKEAVLLLIGGKEGSEVDKPTCRASHAVKVTVSATASPVHLLQHSLVTLGFAKCTDRALARLMPRDFEAKVAVFSHFAVAGMKNGVDSGGGFGKLSNRRCRIRPRRNSTSSLT
jgi:hypothetical protein